MFTMARLRTQRREVDKSIFLTLLFSSLLQVKMNVRQILFVAITLVAVAAAKSTKTKGKERIH